MKVKSEIIKKFRTDKLWSQEQLAQACGLGLRTVQRIEKTGNASSESIRAIASVFEIELDTILHKQKLFDSYRHTQIGYLSMIIFFSILSIIFSATYSNIHTLSENALIGISLICFFLFLVGVLFSSLSITVGKDSLTWCFTFKFWNKKIKIEDIANCHVVENSILDGIGIRLMKHGWLYNVSGVMAVEVVLKSGDKIRLGTDEPEYLAQAIKLALECASDN